MRLVLPDTVLERGSLRIEGGQIAEIIEGPAPRAHLHCSGLTALPGIVDLHGDMLEREVEPRPGAQFPIEMSVMELDKRLAAAGVTTAYAAVSFAENKQKGHIRTEERARELVQGVGRLAESLLVDFRIHARFDVTNQRAAPVLSELVAQGLVDLVSLNDHTPGQGQYRNLEAYLEFMTRWQDLPREEVERRLQERLTQAQPVAWEVVEHITRLAAQAGLPVASHDDDTADKVDLVQKLGATLSEFPVTFEAAHEARRRGMQIIMGAPNALRGSSLTGNLSALDALEAGLLDILASDYYPAALLQAVWLIAAKGLLTLPQAMQLVSRNPARAVGLHDRGRIEIGTQADLVLVDALPHLRVAATLRSGRFIYWSGHPQLSAATAAAAV
ncbi:alpha-D-ribose 1-methylphosphonate 5-triphosphate diphosphatase [Deinococcus oregonensis]|uniref:Alpha-D-ribose 1-methylphosphonate 5-triphosphate diphosphatase n=1 Tax=Deinococcus oregonensis TaxID=1805970 RepID=A0ABV6AVS7_9DEIO